MQWVKGVGDVCTESSVKRRVLQYLVTRSQQLLVAEISDGMLNLSTHPARCMTK